MLVVVFSIGEVEIVGVVAVPVVPMQIAEEKTDSHFPDSVIV